MDLQIQRLTETFHWQNAPSADFAVIAEDASHSLSPRMHNAAFTALGLAFRYVAVNVARGDVGFALDFLRSRAYRGVNVTLPHKEEARAWCSEFINTDYPEVNVANTILLDSRQGFNTDTLGFLRSITPLGLKAGDQCLVLGAGGSAHACIAVLLKLGCRVSLWNRTRERANETNERFSGRVALQKEPDLAGINLLVNATSVGKIGGELPLDWTRSPSDLVAYDLYYAKNPTQFLQNAAAQGLRAMDGSSLLVYQGAEAWRCWGLPEPDVNLMVKEVQDALAI
ncbi:MAG TPA: shikimate dehydrogenase [Fimbriimonadaceae bacterium]